jgi:hypothetical protein
MRFRLTLTYTGPVSNAAGLNDPDSIARRYSEFGYRFTSLV